MFLYLQYANGSRSWEKMYISQTHFGFTNLGSQAYRVWVIAFWIRKFWSWTPCITKNGKTRALKRKNTSKMHKNGFFLNWVEHAILEVHSHSNRSQNFASFSKNPPEKKSCRKRSVKKLFISSLKKAIHCGQKFFYLVNVFLCLLTGCRYSKYPKFD